MRLAWLVHGAALLLLAAESAQAYEITISGGSRRLYLQVGVGAWSGLFSSGATPSSSATVNTVSVTVPATSVGSGSALAMATDSPVVASPYDNFAFCTNAGSMVYVGGYYRNGGGAGNATLTVTAPATLQNGSGDTVPFSSISWASGGAGDTVPTIPSGTFTGGTQTLYTTPVNRWFESCLTFSYANALVIPAGTYTGRVTYTLSAP